MYDKLFSILGFAAPATITLMMPEAPKPIVPEPVHFQAGMKFGFLLNGYFGGVGKPEVPSEAVIDYKLALKDMWDRKLARKDVTPATRKNAALIIERYNNSTPNKMSINDVAWIAHNDAQTSTQSIDWVGLCDKMNANDHQCANAKAAAQMINGSTLVSYSMTELMPGKNGARNYQLYDLLVNTAGWQYLGSIPALGDKYLSFGPYQFTSFAVYDDGKKADGASVVSRYAGVTIASSVVHLGFNEQHTAANYFAIYNLIRVNKRFENGINPRCFAGSNLPVFIATAHHNPGHAIKATVRHVRNGCEGSFLKSFTNKRVKEYGEKTVANFKALSERI